MHHRRKKATVMATAGGRATRNRCCKGIQLIHAHVLVDESSATPGPQEKISFTGAFLVFPEERHTLQGRSACSNCRRTRSRHTPIQSHMVIEYNCRVRCSVHNDIMQLHKVTSRLPHRRSPSQPLHGANSSKEEAAVPSDSMSPREHPSTQIELAPQEECGVASPTFDPPCTIELRPLRTRNEADHLWAPSDLGFAWWLRLHLCRNATFTTAPLTWSWATRASQSSLSDVIHRDVWLG